MPGDEEPRVMMDKAEGRETLTSYNSGSKPRHHATLPVSPFMNTFPPRHNEWSATLPPRLLLPAPDCPLAGTHMHLR